jgi:hypothetical protein
VVHDGIRRGLSTDPHRRVLSGVTRAVARRTRSPIPTLTVILPEDRDTRFIAIRRGGTLTDSDHRLLAVWAAARLRRPA